MNLWLSSTCELQTDFILKENASTAKSRASPDFPSPFGKFYPWKFSHGKIFPKECCIMP